MARPPPGLRVPDEALSPQELSWMQKVFETDLVDELDELAIEELGMELEDTLADESPPGHRCGYVAIIGRPNAGKSTLLNRIVGQRISIVTRKAQTTRNRVLGISSTDAAQMILLDTPGVIQEHHTQMELAMMGNVKRAMADADVVLMIVDISKRPDEDVQMLLPPADYARPPLCLVLNKVDLVSEEQARRVVAWAEANEVADELVLVSAKDGENVERVVRWAEGRLPEGPRLYPKEMVSEHPEKFFVAEIIREKIMLQYEQEVPYATTVHVPVFKERKAGGGKAVKDFVGVDIVVERDSQKAILIGAKGSALKRLATAARLDIEAFLGRGCYLDIKVKTKENWRDSEALLKDYGLMDEAPMT